MCASVAPVEYGSSSPAANMVAPLHIALAGNPNAGKTTLFNALTGMRQKVGNYPGVTVEKKEGRCVLESGGGNGQAREAIVLDLPGTYSLSPKSPDEEIARDVLLQLRPDTPAPDVVLIVVDASNLERNLYLATQILELGYPTVVALNMMDVAHSNGKIIDAGALSRALGVPVVPIVAVRGEGLEALRKVLCAPISRSNLAPPRLPAAAQAACDELAQALPLEASENGIQSTLDARAAIALRLLSGTVDEKVVEKQFGAAAVEVLERVRRDASLSPLAIGALEAPARYALIGAFVIKAVQSPPRIAARSVSDRIDAILTHKIWGLAIFALITLAVFQSIYSLASVPMDWIDGAIKALGERVSHSMAAGPLRDLMVQGVIAGVGAVVIFLPQILILFFFIGLLEDTGYMARAAFLMDRLMSRVGLHGRAFIPLLSSFACAIPGIMATRTIANRRDRMTTILIAPLMACSARLPVYTLMIGSFIPNARLLGPISLRAAVLFSLYVGGVLAAMAMAMLFKKTLFKGPPPPLMLELPPYKIPAWRNIFVTMWERASQFIQRAGTVILAISIVLWFLLNYPKPPIVSAHGGVSPAAGIRPGPGHAPPIVDQPGAVLPKIVSKSVQTAEEKIGREQGLKLNYSFAGQIGRLVEPLIKPLGFNWKIGIGLIGAMSAREVFVSTLGTVYSVADADETSSSLQQSMRDDRWPDGRPVWTTLVAVSLMVYFVLAMQCISTLAVVRRETNSWSWPLFMQLYMTALAWLASFAVYQIGRALGLG